MDAKFEKILGQRFGGNAKRVEVAVGRPDSSNVLWTNRVKTTKYHMITFVFENLWEQFHLFANIYFVGVAVLQLIPSTSDSDGRPTSLYAFVPVLFFTMVKAAWDDYQRHNNDFDINNYIAKRVTRDCAAMMRKMEQSDDGSVRIAPSVGGHTCPTMISLTRGYDDPFVVEEVAWEKLEVGNVIQVSRGDQIPADCVILYTSDKTGTTYVETKNLDGESNLKPKSAIPFTQKHMASYRDPLCAWPADARMTYEGPNSQLFSFTGQIIIGAHLAPIDINNVLLRGSSLQGETAICVVVYTGHMTRVYCNSAEPGMKSSRLTQWYNKHVATLVLLQLLFVMFVTISFLSNGNQRSSWYLGYDEVNLFWLFVANFGAVMLLFAYYVPITLYVSLEGIRWWYKYYIQKDIVMKEYENDPPVKVNDPGVIEDLGIVTHIFSDKTGTLTQNLMTFCAVALPSPQLVCALMDEDGDMTYRSSAPPKEITNSLPHCDPTFPVKQLIGKAISDDLAQYAIILALCHTVIMRTDDDGNENHDGPSPDELALVCGAEILGIRFAGRPSPTEVSVSFTQEGRRLWNKALGVEGDESSTTCTLLATLEFDNVRKRMSVVVEIEGKKLLLCKGADNTMLEVRGEQDMDGIRWLEKHLLELSKRGLRTLILGMRELQNEEFNPWYERWQKVLLQSNEAKEKALAQCVEAIEVNLRLVGATGVEDRLQDGVPDTLSLLQKAGIKLWVLTGDKMETAYKIAKSCNLVLPTTYTCRFEGTDVEAISQKLRELTTFLHAGKLLRTHNFNLDWVKGEKKEYRKSSGQRFDPSDSLFSGAIVNVDAVDSSIRRETQENIDRAISVATLGTFDRELSIAETLGVEEGTDVQLFDTLSLLVTGDCMQAILLNLRLRRQFFKLALSSCHSVICCRVSPMQKSLVVIWSQLYLDSKNKAMLAIGDGSNDVGMICSARIGVGINGKEGSQAARSADISIPQFKYLRRLLFVHGREAWRRNTFCLYFSMYKNVAFCMTGLWYNLFTVYSGGDIYDATLKQWFNVTFSGLPIVLYALFDKQFSMEILYRSPRLYTNTESIIPHAGHLTFTFWFIAALYGSAVCFLIPYAFFAVFATECNQFATMGHCVYLAILVPTNLVIFFESHIIYWFTLGVLVTEFLVYCFVCWIGATFTELDLGVPIFWFGLMLAASVSLIPHTIWASVFSLRMTPTQIVLRAFENHKKEVRAKNENWMEEEIKDKDFYTRDFYPDEACDMQLGTADPVTPHAAIVPIKGQRRE